MTLDSLIAIAEKAPHVAEWTTLNSPELVEYCETFNPATVLPLLHALKTAREALTAIAPSKREFEINEELSPAPEYDFRTAGNLLGNKITAAHIRLIGEALKAIDKVCK